MLMWFEECLGLTVNLKNSEIIPVGTVEESDSLAVYWDVSWEIFPPTTLGSHWVQVIN